MHKKNRQLWNVCNYPCTSVDVQLLTWLLLPTTSLQFKLDNHENTTPTPASFIKVCLSGSLFSFLVHRLLTLSSSVRFQTLAMGMRPHSQSRNICQMKEKNQISEGTRLSLLNCTWREILLNSSWQRQGAGSEIKQSLSRSLLNTTHSLADFKQPRQALCSRAELRSACSQRGFSSPRKRDAPASFPITGCISRKLWLHCDCFVSGHDGGWGTLLFFK